MTIFLKMVKVISVIIGCKINSLRTEPAVPGRIWGFAALPACGGPALMTRRAES
jgi:hypothetical protein